MPRFYIHPDSVKENIIALSKEESHHALSVLRLKEGDRVDLFDGLGNSFEGIVVDLKPGCVAVRVERGSAVGLDKRQAGAAAVPQITLAVSVIKPERMELLVQKACELGVTAIVPLISERCVIKLSKERWESKIKRWQKIALETCKQCGQSRLPQVQPVQGYTDFIRQAKDYEKILIPTLVVPGDILYNALMNSRPQRLLALVGPEGDFTAKEVAMAVSEGATAVSLGPLVLRSETAALYLLSSLNFFYREISKGV